MNSLNTMSISKCKGYGTRLMLWVLVFLLVGLLSQVNAETKQSREAQEYMAKHIKTGITYQLDLSHPLQYQYVVDTLMRSGFNKENSPQSFLQLDATRGLKKSSQANDPQPAECNPTGQQDLCPVNFISNFDVEGSVFSAIALSSIPGGTTKTHILITVMSQNGNILNQKSEDQYNDGTQFTVTVDGSIPPGETDKYLKASALILTYGQDPNVPTMVYQAEEINTVEPIDACMQLPAYKADQPITPLPCTNKITNTDPLEVCWYRGSQGECDYWHQSPSHPTDYEFPVKGYITFDRNIATNATLYPNGFGILNMNLVSVDQGGGCPLNATGSSSGEGALPPGFSVSVSKKQILWDLPKEMFPNPNVGQCMRYGAYLANFYMTLYVLMEDGTWGGGTFTSNRDYEDQSGTYIIPQIDIQEGCFAAGTKILMANGAYKEVEAFTGNGDEQVITGSGKIRSVVGTTRGIEPLPMVRIKDEEGGNVLVTGGHPVVTANRGVVLARDLRKGDVVRRVKGTAQITSISCEPYDGLVYNLRLGTLNDGQRDITSLYANGILMGDNMMQRHYARMAKKISRIHNNILKALPKAWHKDYLYSRMKKYE